METLKIAFVYDAVYPWIKGGAEKRIYEIGRRLAEKGHEVHWYGVGWWFNGDQRRVIDHDGIFLHGVCKPLQLYVNGRRNISAAINFAWKVFPELVRQKFDIVDCQEFPYFPCFSAKLHSILKKSKLTITWHEIWGKYWFGYLGKKGLFGYIVERLTARLAKNNVAVSEQTKRDLEKLGVNGVEVIPNGIDFERIQEVKPSGEESDVVFAGRLIRDKNVDILIKAMRLLRDEIPDIKCVIIGDGPERARLEKLTEDVGLKRNVYFKGFLSEHNDVLALMKSSKVFVLPSTREGFGIVALEANACGLPVITVKHEMNATKDLIRIGKNGFICDLNEAEIAKCVISALNFDMDSYCMEFAKNYDWNSITRKCEKLYSEVI